MSRKSLIAVAAMTLWAACGISPARAGIIIPEEWGGIWESDADTYDCDTNTWFFNQSGPDTMCVGAVIEDPNPGDTPLECTSSADGDSYTSHCEGSFELEPGCMATVTFDMTGTRTGETMTSVSTMRTVYTGTCIEFGDTCFRTETTATRVAESPASCASTPNEQLAWGALKSSYR